MTHRPTSASAASLLPLRRGGWLLLALTAWLLAACGEETLRAASPPECGDGSVDEGEQCDDNDDRSRDGCSSSCEIEAGYACVGEPSVCTAAAEDTGGSGDTGVTDTGGSGDTGVADTGGSGDTTVTDTGGSGDADVIEDSSGSGDTTDTTADTTDPGPPRCGDGLVRPGERCDDGNTDNSDGCNSACFVEPNFGCVGEPSICTATDLAPVCGNSVMEAGEVCDDGNTSSGDGCTVRCNLEAGFACSGSPSVCVVDLCRGVSCTALEGACQAAVCNPSTGICDLYPRLDGTFCDDANLCTSGDSCQAGACTGTATVCADTAGGCATGICNPMTGACDATPLPDCTPCEGGSFCAGGTCGGLPPGRAYSFDAASDLADFTTGGSTPWLWDGAEGHSGTGSLRAGTIGASQSSTLTITVDTASASTLRFWVKTSTESCCDELSLTLNGVTETTVWAGTLDWTEVTRPLPVGRNTITFTYSKDTSLDVGSDTVWIDDLDLGTTAGSTCVDNGCGESVFNGTSCVVCEPQPDGAACDTVAGDCTSGTCNRGACIPEPVANGTSCNAGSECAVGSCRAGVCDGSTVVPDCTPCAGGTDFCGGGVCGGSGATVVDFSDAADTAAFTTVTGSAWSADAAQGHDAPAAFRSGATATSATSRTRFTTTVTSAGTELRFWLKTSSESGFDKLRLYVNGTVDATTWSGETAWTEVVRTLPVGTVTIEFEYGKDGSGISGSDAVWIDDLSVTSGASRSCLAGACGDSIFNGTTCLFCDSSFEGVSCDTDAGDCVSNSCTGGACVANPVANGSNCASGSECAVGSCSDGTCAITPLSDCTTCAGGTEFCAGGLCGGVSSDLRYGFETAADLAAFRMQGAQPWATSTVAPHSGTSAMKSGTIADSQRSRATLSLTLDRASTLTFWLKTSSESTYDKLVLVINGTDDATTWSGETAWTQVTRPVPAGATTIEFAYRKDISNAVGSDAVWVDDITIADAGNQCAGSACGDSVFDGTACVSCDLSFEGLACENDPTDCNLGVCAAGRCAPQPVSNGADCVGADDPCNVGACLDGSCTGFPVDNGTACPGFDDACNAGACIDGVCSAVPLDDGTNCDTDFSDCLAAACVAGRCQPQPVADCSICGAAGDGLCGGGTCQSISGAQRYGFEGSTATTPFTMSGNTWFVDTTNRQSGGASLRSPVTAVSTTHSASLSVTAGPGQSYSFWLLTSSEANADYLIFAVDGVQQGRWSGLGVWTRFEGALTAGVHTLTWSYSKDAASAAGSDTVWVDDIVIGSSNACGADSCGISVLSGGSCVACDAPAPDCTLCAGGTDVCVGGRCGGVGSEGFFEDFEDSVTTAITPGSSSIWGRDASAPSQGGMAYRSGTIAAGATSSFRAGVTLASPGAVTFDYRVSAGAGDLLKFFVDGVEKLSVGGERPWASANYPLAAGSHNMEWRFTRSAAAAVGDNAAWIDVIAAGDATACGGDVCGAQGYDGANCQLCPLRVDGASCDSDAADCMGATCAAGSCLSQPLPDGLSCDGDTADCLDATCNSGLCVASGRADCASCGTAGNQFCAGGECGGLTNPGQIDFERPDAFSLFTTTGQVLWTTTTDRPRTPGSTAARVGRVGNGRQGILRLSIDLPSAGTLSFAYLRRMTTGTGTNDSTYFYVDPGATLTTTSAAAAWTGASTLWETTSLPVTAGRHEFVWQYSSQLTTGNYPNDDRMFYLDDLVFSALAACTSPDTCTSSLYDGAACLACDTGLCAP